MCESRGLTTQQAELLSIALLTLEYDLANDVVFDEKTEDEFARYGINVNDKGSMNQLRQDVQALRRALS